MESIEEPEFGVESTVRFVKLFNIYGKRTRASDAFTAIGAGFKANEA